MDTSRMSFLFQRKNESLCRKLFHSDFLFYCLLFWNRERWKIQRRVKNIHIQNKGSRSFKIIFQPVFGHSQSREKVRVALSSFQAFKLSSCQADEFSLMIYYFTFSVSPPASAAWGRIQCLLNIWPFDQNIHESNISWRFPARWIQFIIIISQQTW